MVRWQCAQRRKLTRPLVRSTLAWLLHHSCSCVETEDAAQARVPQFLDHLATQISQGLNR
ncbi:hypothetical protein DAI22_05g218442 [Oryza sativa Japonica Group]|nr:hypothetical protein DAI22_05g218442 [Oryza sativa Japonica Group]